jgi:hypothetical protein
MTAMMSPEAAARWTELTKPLGMTDDNHKYGWQGAGPWPSVTGITGWQDGINGSGGLTTWAAKIAAEAVWATADATFIPLENATAIALTALNRQRNIGSSVHGKVADLLAGKAWTRTPETGLYLDGYSLFMAQHHPEFIYSEQVVLSPSRSYGGRFDIIAKLGRRTALIDVKTGKAKKSHALQLAGYEDADFIGYPDDPRQYPIPRIQDYYLLLLREGSYELIPITVTMADRRHFRELTKMFHKARAWEKS